MAQNDSEPNFDDLLLNQDPNPNATDELGRTRLHLACGIDRSLGDAILPKSSRFQQVNWKKIHATEKRTLKLIHRLVQTGISLDATDSNGESALFHIFRDDTHDYLARKFSRSSLDYRIHKDQFRRSKLSIVSRLRLAQLDKLRYLLFLKANVGIRSYETGDTILHKAIKDLKTSREPGQFGEPLFDDAVHARMIRDILKSGLDVNVENRRGETPLSLATSVLSFQVVRVLLNHGAKPRDINFTDGFAYPKLLPSPEAVDNLMGIAALRGGNLSEEEILAVLGFLVGNNVECKYADPGDEDAADKLKNLLAFGTDENILNSMQRIMNDEGNSRVIVGDQIGRYLAKLRIIGTIPSREVEDCLVGLTRLSANDIPHKEHQQFQTEAARLKQTTLKVSGRSLASILSSSPTRDEEREILRLRYLQFQRDLPHYWGIVGGFLVKFLTRRFVVRLMNERIRFVSTKPLPDNCCEKIASYLSNEDLLRLFIASRSHRVVEADRALADRLSSSLKIV